MTANLKVIVNPEKKKYRRHNKNKKKAWRKNIDITDIEEALVEKRREERYGGPVNEKKSDELFNIDFTDQKKQLDELKIKRNLKSKKKNILKKTLKCHQFLKGLPGVKPISKPRPPCRQSSSKLMRTAFKLHKDDSLKSEVKRLMAKDQHKMAILKNNQRKNPKVKERDVWNEDTSLLSKVKKEKNLSKIDATYIKKGLDHFERVTKTKICKVPAIRQMKPTSISAVLLPHPGISVNPSKRDHRKLSNKALKEKTKEKIQTKKENAIRKKYLSKKNKLSIEKGHLEEMSEGLPLVNKKNSRKIPEEKDEEVSMSFSAPKVTKKARVNANKVAEKQREIVKKKLLEESQVYKAESILKEINKAKKASRARFKRRRLVALKKQSMTQQVSRHKFNELKTLVPNADKMSDSMRKITPMGNLMDEHYKSLQRRNIIEPKGKGQFKKAKRKKYAKRSLTHRKV